MEVKIGVQYAAREVVIDSDQTVEDIEQAVTEALGGGLLSLLDRKGRHVMVPGDKITYVEIGGGTVGAVGFRG
ncbi:MAG: DUF3107 domain-containing protein [Nocardioides sp.]